jgi:hypothetical protein
METLKKIIRKTFLYRILKSIREERAYHTWRTGGKVGPQPHCGKVRTIKKTAETSGADVLIETGTYLGDTLYATRNFFTRIVSIELDRTLAENAVRRFERFPHISILQGDSAALLPGIIKELTGPALFWLDAHYSGHITARSDKDTPIEAELASVAQSPHRHVILIDDARCFDGTHDYPTIEKLHTTAARLFPRHTFTVTEDIIRIEPSKS